MSTEKKKTILIIDDETLNLKLLTHILGAEYTVYASKGGQECIDLAKKNLPDLILMDIIMPGMSGIEVLAALRASETTKMIPVMIVTGLDLNDEKVKAMTADAAGCISKPLNANDVKVKVRDHFKIVSSGNEIT